MNPRNKRQRWLRPEQPLLCLERKLTFFRDLPNTFLAMKSPSTSRGRSSGKHGGSCRWLSLPSARRVSTCWLLAVVLLGTTQPASAQVRIAVDGLLSRPLNRPQMDEFGLGGGGGLATEWSPHERVGLVARFLGLALPPYAGALPEGFERPGTGTLFALMGGVRFRPLGWLFDRPADGIYLEGNAGGALTGTNVRPLVSVRAGVSFRLGPIATGPYVAYTRVFEMGDSLLPGDAQLLSLGLELVHALARQPSARPVQVRRAPEISPSLPTTTSRCPLALRLTFEDFDRDGCPDSDRDGDTLADVRDRCPDLGEDFDGFEDADGCPDNDNDQDTVGDLFDACPREPETVNGVEDNDGCPDTAPVQVVRGRIQLADTIQFAFNSVRILEASYPIVRAVAQVLLAHPEYRTVYVEGHADEIGPDHYNYNLSYQRARAVVDLLVQFGVERNRLVPMGFGRSCPLDTSGTPAARARNRRVEFVVDGHRSSGRARTAHGYVDIPREESQ